ncbi:hypothetical protein ACSW9U_16530 (plasmid) [Clostridium perfringens]
MDKTEYLIFESKYHDSMNVAAINCNRKKYGITKKDLVNFYGENYPGKRKNKSDKYNKKNLMKEKFTREQVSAQLKHLKKIFNTTDEAFIRFRSKANGEYYNYNINSVFVEDKLYNVLNSKKFTKEDLMYSLNLYNNMKIADESHLFSLHSIAIDVDFKEIRRFKDKSPKQIINILEKLEFNNTIPIPNCIEYGNNLRLIYFLETAYSTKTLNTLAKRISVTIGERLADYGGKGQPLTTYARVLNSINSRNKSEIQVMYLDVNRYTVKELKDRVLPPLPDWYNEWKSKSKRKVINFKNDFQAQAKSRKYNEARVNDFFKIQEFFDFDCDGRRFLCFQVRNHCILAGMTSDEAKEVMMEFNNRFKYPLKWNVIEQDTRNVERKQYLYKSQYILDNQCITPEDEEIIGLEAILSKTEKNRRHNIKEKARQKAKYRDEEGLTNTEVKRRNQFILIARMELKDMSYRAIAKEMGFSDHKAITRKVNKLYDKINYFEILEEVRLGLYDDLQGAIG